jgi:LPXTG-motif cell wall-anchored protein
MVFKRGKNAGASPGWPAKIGTLAAGIGGLLGGLLFWRKRKTN